MQVAGDFRKYVEPNESIEAAVLRELKEETNIEGSISGFIGLGQPKPSMVSASSLCYKIQSDEFTIQPQDDEISNARFYNQGIFQSRMGFVAMRGFAEVALKDTSLPLIDLSVESKRPYHLVFSDGRMTLSEEVVR